MLDTVITQFFLFFFLPTDQILAQEQVLELLPMVGEANAVSEELDKKMYVYLFCVPSYLKGKSFHEIKTSPNLISQFTILKTQISKVSKVFALFDIAIYTQNCI